MKILIWTDLEGVSGITEFDLHEKKTPQNVWQSKLMTGEVNAAIRACFDCGATHVKVAEGHDSIDILELDERATIVPACFPAIPQLQGWDEGFDAMLLIGCHSMAGTADGMLCHTGNRRVIYDKINDLIVGEIGNAILCAGDYNIPAIMMSGDFAACREAKAFSSNIETASVKKGYDQFHGDCMHPTRARDLIYEKVCKAIKRLEDFKPIKVEGPICFEEKKIVNETDSEIVRFYGDSVTEAFGRRCGYESK